MTTRQLSLNVLSDAKNYRHGLMMQMVAESFSHQQIANVFNRLEIKSPSGKYSDTSEGFKSARGFQFIVESAYSTYKKGISESKDLHQK